MGSTLVLCVLELTRKYGGNPVRYSDSVMISAEFEDQIYPKLEAHFFVLLRRDPRIVRWKLKTWLPQRPLKKSSYMRRIK